MRIRLRIGLVVLVTLVLAVAAACTRTHGAASRSGSGAAAPTASTAVGQGAMQMGGTGTTGTSAAKATPAQLRASFEQLLGQHALLAVRLMRSVATPAPDFRQAATASLRQNTDALAQLVTSAYGSAQGGRFRQLWERHITDLLAYANGVASHNASVTQTARTDLLADAEAYGSWFAQASKGRVRASDAAAGVRMHVEDLMGQLDAYAAGDDDRAYQIERMAFEHMFTAGAALAKASLPPEVAVGLDAAPQQLRSAFAMLLGEHMELVIDAQRAAFAGSREFGAAAAQLNANTSALAKAMGAIVGPKKGAEFQSDWADHVEGLMAYTAAVAGKDEAAKAVAEKRLNSFAVALATYFSGVVRDPSAFVPLTAAITAHDTHLMDQADAYAAKDYAKAQQMEADGYQQMLGVANLLVDSIQRVVAPALPKGGSQTGGGGTAQRP
jgi:hypothetical protein